MDPISDPNPTRDQKATKKVFLLITFLKDIQESHKEVAKQQESRFFLLFLLDDIRIRSRIRTSDLQIRIWEAQNLRIRIRNTEIKYEKNLKHVKSNSGFL